MILITPVWETIFFKHSPKWQVDWNKYSPKWNRARHVWRVTFFFLNLPTNTKYSILRTISRYIFSLNTLASTYRPHRPIQGWSLKNLEFLKKISIKMTILFTVYLYFAVVFFLNKKTEIIDVLGVIFFLNKAIKVYRGCNSGEKISIQWFQVPTHLTTVTRQTGK